MSVRRFTLALALCGLLGGSAMAQSFDYLVGEADKARGAKDWPRTIELLKKAHAIKALPELLNNIGRSYEEMGWYRDAMIAYERVANDPEAAPALRALDAGRSSKLQTKLGKAFLRIVLGLGWDMTHVEGKKLKDAALEVEVDEGKVPVEILSKDKRALILLWPTAIVDRRIDIVIPSAESPSRAVLTFGDEFRLQRLVAGDDTVHSPLGGVREIVLAPGRVEFLVGIDEGPGLKLKVDAQGGASQDLTEALRAAKRLRDLRLAKEDEVRSQVGPYVTTGAGGLALGVGFVFLWLAGEDRFAIANSRRDENGVVTSMTLAQAQELADGASTKDSLGQALLGVGGAALATGITWFLVNMARGRKAADEIESAGLRIDPTGILFGF